MVPSMKVNGKAICSMAKEKRLGMMDQNTLVITSMAKNKDMASIAGMMGQCIKENGWATGSKGMELISG